MGLFAAQTAQQMWNTKRNYIICSQLYCTVVLIVFMSMNQVHLDSGLTLEVSLDFTVYTGLNEEEIFWQYQAALR